MVHWVAIDDRSSVAAAREAEHRFIACDAARGLSDEAVRQVLRAMLSALPRALAT
ncbi:hypothetical protein ACW9YQ_07265 [Paraburkholderia strydomiana]